MSSNINEDKINGKSWMGLLQDRSLSACQVGGGCQCQCTDAMCHLCKPRDCSEGMHRMRFPSVLAYVEIRSLGEKSCVSLPLMKTEKWFLRYHFSYINSFDRGSYVCWAKIFLAFY